MELYHLRSFVTVADAGGVSKAARILHLAQPAVSQHLKGLEKELGIELFERGPRGMKLTDAGMSLLGQARLVLTDVSEFKSAAEQFYGDVDNRVTLAITPSLAASLLPRVIELLLAGSSNVRPVLYERPTQDALTLLATGSFDLAVVRDVYGAGFEITPILEEPLYLAVAANHELLRDGRRPGLGDFRDVPFFFFRHTGRETLYQGAYQACLNAGFTPRRATEGAETSTLGELVRRGLGACIAPLTVIRLWPADDIAIIPLDEPAPRTTAFIARVQGRVTTPAAARVQRSITKTASVLAQELAAQHERIVMERAPVTHD